MHLETTEGARADISKTQLARMLERPAPLTALHGGGIALVAIHADGPRYSLMHWNGRAWRRTAPAVHEENLTPRFTAFLEGDRNWQEGLEWETIVAGGDEGLPSGLHVLLTYVLALGGFATGALLGVAAGRAFPAHETVLAFVFAVLFAPPLAILGQHAARRIPSACRHCGESAIAIHAGRFSYLCPRCGDVHITRWGIHRGPMSP